MMLIALIAATSLVAEAKQEIAAHSPNPSAVRFNDVREGDGIVCGMVNRPNRAGGYDGFELFIYKSKGDWSIGESGGLVMNDGQLTDIDYLNARTATVGYRQPTEQDVEYTEEANAAQHVRLTMLRSCPEKLNSD